MANGRVTIRDVFEVADRMEDKLDKMDDKHCEMVKELGTRITTIEAWQNNIKGKIALAVGIATLCINLTWDYIRGKWRG